MTIEKAIATATSYIEHVGPVLVTHGVRPDGGCTCPAGSTCPPKQRGKHPHGYLAANGYKSASIEIDKVKRWLRTSPELAVVLGHQRGDGFVFCLDADVRNGGDVSLAALVERFGPLPTTLEDVAPNGGHLYLAAPFQVKSTTIRGFDGIDVLGAGSYAKCFGTHSSGLRYQPGEATTTPVARAPEWLLSLLTAKREFTGKRVEGLTGCDTVLGEACKLSGLKIGPTMADGIVWVECPFAGVHSDDRGWGDDSSTVLLPPLGTSRLGRLRCTHRCRGRGVFEFLDECERRKPGTKAKAKNRYPAVIK